jgi:hypothetical protein
MPFQPVLVGLPSTQLAGLSFKAAAALTRFIDVRNRFFSPSGAGRTGLPAVALSAIRLS